jgi:hypothetical protein
VDQLKNHMGSVYQRLTWFIWAALLILLPITSLPLLQDLVGGEAVAPASAISLVILVLLWLLPYLARRGKLPSEIIPILGFLAVAIVATAFAFYMPISTWKNQSVFSRSRSAWLTLGTGISFCLVTVTIVDSKKKLVKSLKYVNVGALMMLFWSLAQGYYVYMHSGEYPRIMHVVHDLLSVRELLSLKVTGLAYESSWLAHQLNILYFPLWLGAVSQAYSAYRRRLTKVPFEALMLLGGIVVLLLAQSRIGLVGFLAIITFMVIRLVFLSSRKVGRKVGLALSRHSLLLGRCVGVCVTFILVLLAITSFFYFTKAFVNLASRIDWRLERIFMVEWPKLVPFNPAQILAQFRGLFNVYFANYLMFGERAVYWIAASRVFNAHPFFGVGLGNAGFFFKEHMPAFAWALPEVVEVMRDGTHMFPNPKVLWLRLLAETGIVGFTFFIVWLLVMLARAWQLMTHSDKLYTSLGLAGIFGLVAILVEGFSLDTFGLPYMWVLLGLVSAAARISRTSPSGTNPQDTVS